MYYSIVTVLLSCLINYLYSSFTVTAIGSEVTTK